MTCPLAIFTILFCLGILTASAIKINFLCLYFFSLPLFIAAFLLRKKTSSRFLLFSLVFILGILSLQNFRILPSNHIRKLFYYKDGLYNVKGIVAAEPLRRENKTSFIFKTREILSDNLKINCTGNIMVNITGNYDFSYGDELILKGKLFRPPAFTGNSRNSYRDYLSRQGIYLTMNVKTFVRLKKSSRFSLVGPSLNIKKVMEKVIFKYNPDLVAGILDAMLLGERENIPVSVSNSMMKTGTVHILVVSGFNVGIVAFIIILFLRLIRVPRAIRFCVTILCLIVYCFMTGATNPVARATVMGIFLFLALLLKRESNMYNSLSLACLFILVFCPQQLFDIGFQLSFVSVFSIIYLYPKLKALLRIEKIKSRCLLIIPEGFLVSLSAWLGTFGFIAYNFRIFSPVTVFANILIVPMATLITLSGFSLIFMGLVFPPLAWPFAYASEFFVALLLKINAFLIKLPGAYFYLP